MNRVNEVQKDPSKVACFPHLAGVHAALLSPGTKLLIGEVVVEPTLALRLVDHLNLGLYVIRGSLKQEIWMEMICLRPFAESGTVLRTPSWSPNRRQ